MCYTKKQTAENFCRFCYILFILRNISAIHLHDPAAFYASAYEAAVRIFDRPAPLG